MASDSRDSAPTYEQTTSGMRRNPLRYRRCQSTAAALYDLETEDGPVHPICGVRGVERDVWELIQWRALHDEGRRRLGRPEDDRALFAKFLSFRECISHFGGKSDNALLVLGDRHPCSWWYVLEKFTEVRHWRCHRNHPLPNRLDANPSGFHRSQYAPWCGANQGTNGSGSVCLGRRVVCNAASRLKGGCGQDCPPSKQRRRGACATRY